MTADGPSAADVLVPAVLAGLAVAVALGAPSPVTARLRLLAPQVREPAHRATRSAAGPVPGEEAGPGRPARAVARAGRAAAPRPARSAPPPSSTSWVHLARRPLLPGAVLVLTAPVGWAVAGPLPALAALLLALTGLRAWASGRTRQERQAERTGAVEALAALGAELRAGRTPACALGAAAACAHGPLRPVLSTAATTAAHGGDVAQALRGALPSSATAVPAVVSSLAACWQVSSGAGTGLAAAVGRLEEGLRADELGRRAVDAELAGPRATAVVLALLPLAGTGLAAALGARPLHVLLETVPGGVCLLAAVVLDVLGLVWTARLARSVTSAGDRW